MIDEGNEIKDMIINFLDEYPEGHVTLLYPSETEFVREGIHGTGFYYG